MVSFALLVPFLVASLQPTLSAAFSWHLTTVPTQCSNLTISIVGSDGQPPYRVFIMPSGPSPLANNVDVRAMIDQPFDGNSTTVSFPINYPANSHFIAAVSDANGFGTGGVSVETLVEDSNDASCFNPNKTSLPLFTYGIGGDNHLTQCQPTRVWWNASDAQGTVSFYGVVPGGQCFELSSDNPDVQNQETGFAWTPNLRGGSTVIIVGGDSRGMGTAGCAQFTVQPASNTTCLDNTSPSSTAGIAAGSLETNAPSSRSSSSSSSTANNGGPNVGVIVGAAVGGIIGLMALIAFIVLSYYCLRQDGRRTRRLQRRAPPAMASIGNMPSPASHQLSVPPRQGTSIATTPDERLAHYSPEPFSFAGVGTYNNGYPYGGQGYTGGMAPGTASAASPRSRLDSVTSGSGVAMSDTSSNVGSRYGLQGANPGLHQQTSGLLSVKSGLGLYDAASQSGSRYGGAPSVMSNTSGPRAGPSTLPYENTVPRGGPSALSYENTVPRGGPSALPYENTVPREPPPAFTPSYMGTNPPTGDIKYKVKNPG